MRTENSADNESEASPRLVAVSGPLRDSTFVISKADVSIGRDPANMLSINDPSLSRRHCLIVRDGNSFKIRDLQSRNGTYVNGSAVQETELRPGDQISIGDSVLLFQGGEEAEAAPVGSVQFDDHLTHATAELRPQDVLYLQPDRILSELPATSRLGRNLNVLLKISRVVHAIRELDRLQAEILKLSFEVAPAERGAILLGGKPDVDSATVFARHRGTNSEEPVRVSRTVARRVLEQGVAILGADVLGSGGLSGVQSLVLSNVRSLLCVPLTVFDNVIGCIYLDTTTNSGRFDEDHLQLVAAIAGISAVALANAQRLHWLEQENLRLATEISVEHNMVGDSQRIKDVYKFIGRTAPTDSTILITGESGTGKELAARAIHRNSLRAGKSFVAINCAAIPEGLLESELFGHEKGSYTGAVGQKKGRLEIGDGGTVLLDEIGELAPSLQVKLLRVLQEHEFERVGGTRTISVDIRLVAATNRDLAEEVKAGTFRQDLYYRLNVVSLEMPPLRERREDIPMLAEYFVQKSAKKCKVKVKPISPEAMACLENYDWPGNVRELENAVERALVLSPSEEIRPEDLPESVLEKDPPPGISAPQYHTAVKELKKKLILQAVADAKGSYTDAARILGVHPNYLHRLIRNLAMKELLRNLDDSTVSRKRHRA